MYPTKVLRSRHGITFHTEICIWEDINSSSETSIQLNRVQWIFLLNSGQWSLGNFWLSLLTHHNNIPWRQQAPNPEITKHAGFSNKLNSILIVEGFFFSLVPLACRQAQTTAHVGCGSLVPALSINANGWCTFLRSTRL